MDIPDHSQEQQHAPGAQADLEDMFTLEGASTSQEHSMEPQDTRFESNEGCPVCGDKISGYHYGLLTCESCKGFFKRSVQNDKHYTCAEGQSCPMDVSQRKRCPSCRFQKCLAVGMKKEAVRADRMRGGRNKFGPLYRQMKEQKVQPQANAAPYSIKMEVTQRLWSSAASDCPLMCNHTSAPMSPDAFHHPRMMCPSGMGGYGAHLPFDCTVGDDGMVPPLPLSYPGLHHQTYTLRSAPSTSSLCSTPSCSIPLTPPTDPANAYTSTSTTTQASSFLSQLLEGEQDESQLCAKVVASLQREQANRGKHDCLNTFSIMCKMADQTLFSLVEWARNSALFKELKVNILH